MLQQVGGFQAAGGRVSLTEFKNERPARVLLALGFGGCICKKTCEKATKQCLGGIYLHFFQETCDS